MTASIALPLAASGTVGAKGLYLLFAWLLSAIAASWLADRAGYPERLGLGTGLILTVAGALIWLVIYLVWPRPGSLRAVDGPIPKRRREEGPMPGPDLQRRADSAAERQGSPDA